MRWSFTAFLTLSVLCAGHAFAESSASLEANVAALPMEEMAKNSNTVVLGKVVRNTARWAGKVIVTTSEVATYQVLKGAFSGATVEVSFLGGTVGVINQHATHQATLEEGELVVLFLSDGKAGAPFLRGTKRINGESGKISLLAPGFSEARFKDDRRLHQLINRITARVSKGG